MFEHAAEGEGLPNIERRQPAAPDAVACVPTDYANTVIANLLPLLATS